MRSRLKFELNFNPISASALPTAHKPPATAGNWSQWLDCISKLRPCRRVIARVVGQAEVQTAVPLLIF